MSILLSIFKNVSQTQYRFTVCIFLFGLISAKCTKKQSLLQPLDSVSLQKSALSSELGFKNGSGTIVDPYLIYNEEDFYQMVSGNAAEIHYYQLMNDLVLTQSQEKLPLPSLSFIHLEGNNFSISKIYFITSQSNSGIFTQLYNSKIQNLKLHDIDIKGQIYTAVLAGSAQHVELNNIQVSGAYIQGSSGVGGLVATTVDTKITNSKTSGRLLVKMRTAGGIVAAAYGNTQIENCSSTMIIDASLAKDFWLVPISVGGIIGRIQTDDSSLTIIANNFADNIKIIGQPNASDQTKVGYPGFNRVVGVIVSGPVLLYNNLANGAMEMQTADGQVVEISDLNKATLGVTQLHGGTIHF